MMDKRSIWNITGRPSGDAYEALLRGVAERSTKFAFLVRSPSVKLSERAVVVMDELTPYLVGSEETQEWPGTQLVGSRMSTRYTFLLTTESLEVLIAAALGLFEWVNPTLPEDLHFLRADGSTVLGNVAQEDDAWLELEESETVGIVDALPAELGLRRA
ncbi:MAG: hypothetical protein JWQ32_903 [Marmoricola sp.]|nr:hypothetical protein [Marmoricola sp.]